MFESFKRYCHWLDNLLGGMLTGYDFDEGEKQVALARVECDAVDEKLRTNVQLALGALVMTVAYN